MKFNFQQAVRAIILIAFSAMLFKMHYSGDITKFINPKYIRLSQSASVLFLFLFFIQITRIWTVKNKEHDHAQCHHDDHSHCQHDHGHTPFNTKKLIGYGILIFPLLTGFFLPAKVLDASIADKKGAMLMIASQQQRTKDSTKENNNESTSEIDDNLDVEQNPLADHLDPNFVPEQKEISKEEYNKILQALELSQTIEMKDNVYNTYYEEISKDIDKYIGRTIKLKGFVYKEAGLETNQLVISRFLITHCVADASIIGFLSEFPEAEKISQDTWLEATGVLDITTYGEFELPILKITEWKETEEPSDPYLYPVSVRIL